MKKNLLLLLCIPSFLFGQEQYYRSFMPSSTTGQVVHHKYYSLSYSEEHETSEWTIYHLTKDRLSNSIHKRINNFKTDPLINTGSAELTDYRGSGFDGGHLIPAADMAFDSIAMSESFYFSNICLQTPWFNRGVNKRLESQVREWVNKKDSLIIITGVIFRDSNYAFIGNSKVAVPASYYKIVTDLEEMSSIAILYPFELKKIEGVDYGSLLPFIYTIDEIEEMTGVNFFQNLPKSIQNTLEKEVKLEDWFQTYERINKSRAALIIGNKNYQTKKDVLINPINDAKLIRETLNEAGFDTILYFEDLTLQEMKTVFDNFIEIIYDYDMSMIFYAGHGIQDELGNSYLVPIDYRRFYIESNIEKYAYSLSKVSKLISEDSRALVVIDACRSTLSNGLGSSPKLEAIDNLEVIFSTQYGKVASDNPSSNNSYFSEGFSKAIKQFCFIEEAFDATRIKVFSLSHHNQKPVKYGWVHCSSFKECKCELLK